MYIKADKNTKNRVFLKDCYGFVKKIYQQNQQFINSVTSLWTIRQPCAWPILRYFTVQTTVCT